MTEADTMCGVVPTRPPSTISNSVPSPPWPRPLLPTASPPAAVPGNGYNPSHKSAVAVRFMQRQCR